MSILRTYNVQNPDSASVNVELSANGGVRVAGLSTFSGELRVGTGVTISGSAVSATGLSTFSGGIQVGATTSITVGSAFIKNNAVGLGTTNTTGRNSGVGTASGTLIFNNDTNTVDVWNGSNWVSVGGGPSNYIQATGGIINEFTSGSTVYRTHVFTASGTFSVTSAPPVNNSVEYVVIGGGGGGSDTGGGGAGGLRTSVPGITDASSVTLTEAKFIVSSGTYPVIVGAGGMGAIDNSIGTSGAPSSLAGIIESQGGGRGGGGFVSPQSGADGGSGGGGGGNDPANSIGWGGFGNRLAHVTLDPSSIPLSTAPPSTASFAVPRQGNRGGNSRPDYWSGGGGGGAGSAGSPSPSDPTGGAGGIGVNFSPTVFGPGNDMGTPGPNPGRYFAGGGGGAGPSTGGAGGSGGGGTGGTTAGGGGSGTSNTGSGGGGQWEVGPMGGNGGSGLVMVRYPILNLGGTAKATGGSITFYNGKTIHTFTASGTFTNTSGSPLTVDHVVVAGGGSGGGRAHGGGGGAGGVRSSIPGLMPATDSQITVSPGPPNAVTVTVGAGGAGRLNGNGLQGSSSSFGPTTPTTGGGYGSRTTSGETVNAGPGGSGGGGGGFSGAGGPATPGQGNVGGTGGPGSWSTAGGGGGAGGAGSNGNGPFPDGLSTGQVGGNGGIGVQLPSIFRDPNSLIGAPGPGGGSYWIGGGGGGAAGTGGTPGKGGGPGGPYAGGGDGSGISPVGVVGGAGIPGASNTGGGGGGAERSYPNDFANAGGNGGSGIVLIAYPS